MPGQITNCGLNFSYDFIFDFKCFLYSKINFRD
jgi:hypothetical protein